MDSLLGNSLNYGWEIFQQAMWLISGGYSMDYVEVASEVVWFSHVS